MKKYNNLVSLVLIVLLLVRITLWTGHTPLIQIGDIHDVQIALIQIQGK